MILFEKIAAPLIVMLLAGIGTGIWAGIRQIRKDMADVRHIKERVAELPCYEQGAQIDVLHSNVKRLLDVEEQRRAENTLIIKSLFAITDGLLQLKCNGKVTECNQALETFLIEERR